MEVRFVCQSTKAYFDFIRLDCVELARVFKKTGTFRLSLQS